MVSTLCKTGAESSQATAREWRSGRGGLREWWPSALCRHGLSAPPWRPPRVFSFSAGMSSGCAGLPEEGRRRERAPASWAWAWQRGGGGSAAVASRVWRASCLGGRGRLGAAPRPPRVTFVARGAGVGGLLPAGCRASVACSLCLPGRVGSVGRVRSRPRGTSSPLPVVACFPGSPLPEGTSARPPGREFLEVRERRARWDRTTSTDPRPCPKVGAAGAAPPHTACLPRFRALEARNPTRTVLPGYRFPVIFSCQLAGCIEATWQGWGLGGVVACVAVQPCRCGSLASRRAGGGESLAAVAPSRLRVPM